MGQQQMLLLVLAVILIAIGIAAVNRMYREQIDMSERDNLTNVLNNVGLNAYKYYLRPDIVNGAQRNWQRVIDEKNSWMPTFESGIIDSDELFVELGGPGLLIYGRTPSEKHKGIVGIANDGVQRIKWSESWE